MNDFRFCDKLTLVRSALSIYFCVVFSVAPAFAQNSRESYRIGQRDVLSITFWQQPDLNSEIRVGENGMITIPVIGDIKAEGMTTTELADAIVEQMAFFHTPISQATVAILEFNSLSVVVTGQVLRPLSLSYENIPDLWRVILDAGGPTELADLSNVTIVRENDDESRLLNVNLYEMIKKGDLTKAPKIQAGDLINVPASAFGAAMQLGERAQFEGRNIYYILGNVAIPGVKTLDTGIDVLDAITLAGGFTDGADLKNVRVVMKGPRYSNVVKINLENYIEKGTPPRLTLHPEDTIIVPSREGSRLGEIAGTVFQIVPLLSAIGTFILLLE